MERRALLAWLLEVLRGADEPTIDPPAADAFEAIVVLFRGKQLVIRVEELAA